MIINRKMPNLFSVSWSNKGAVNFQSQSFQFHPGENFISDAEYFLHIEKNPDFISQVNAGHMTIDVPPRKVAKAVKGKEQAPATPLPTSMMEAVKELSKEKAIEIVKNTLDAVELQEIIRFDGRPAVVKAAEGQLDNRQTFMDSLSPSPVKVNEKQQIALPGHEDVKDLF